MKRLVLHLGLHKTGTSYLQLWLYHNRKALEAAGVLYPDFHMKHPNQNHHWFAKQIEAGADLDGMARELDAIPGRHRTIVLSAEHLSTVLHADQDRSRRFQELFASRFKLTLVVYVRRQDEMLESAFAQMVKARHVGVIEDMLDRPMNWRRRMDVLSSIFGREAMVVRPYYPAAWHQRHLGLDFLSAGGLDLPDGLEEIERTNESLTRRKTLFLSTLDKTRIPRLAEFVEHVRRSPAIRHDNGRWLLSHDRRAALVKKYAASNAGLVKDYMEGQWEEYFLAPPDDGDSWFPASPITTDERHDLLKEIWRQAVRNQPKSTAAAPDDMKIRSA